MFWSCPDEPSACADGGVPQPIRTGQRHPHLSATALIGHYPRYLEAPTTALPINITTGEVTLDRPLLPEAEPRPRVNRPIAQQSHVAVNWDRRLGSWHANSSCDSGEIMRTVAAVVYPNFELLDLFGPLEMFGWLSADFRIVLVGSQSGRVLSNMGVATIADAGFQEHHEFDVLLIPGGWGRSTPVDTASLTPWLHQAAGRADRVLTVCTGSALLALTGLLDGREATTNKALFTWVAEKRPDVKWRARARWVRDGKFYTSTGVSAGMDMTFATNRRPAGAE